MATIVPGLPGAGYYLGQGLGRGLSTGLQQLAEQRVQGLQRKQKTDSLIAAGFTPEEAGFIVDNPELAQPFLSSLSASGSVSQQQPQQSAGQDLSQLLAPTQQQGQPALQQLQQPLTPQQKVAEEFKATNVPQEQQAVTPAVPAKLTIKEQLAKGMVNKQDKKDEQERIDKETLPYYNDLLKEDRAAKNAEKRLAKMEALIKKGDLPIAAFYNLIDTLSEISPTHAAGAGAALGTLIGGGLGSLGGPAGTTIGGLVGRAAGPAIVGSVLGSFVTPIASALKSAQRWTSPDTEQFEKLTADFIKDAKQFFGARVTNDELKAFLKTVPSLSVTDNGKKQIIDNMRNFFQATHLRAEIMKDIIRENGGRRPANLEILVEERAVQDLDTLAENFVSGVKKAEKIADKNDKKLARQQSTI